MGKIIVTNGSKLEWKIGSTIILIVFGLMIYSVIWFFYRGPTDEIIRIANQLEPEKNWTLVSEHIEAPGNFCIDVDCPSLSRTWVVPLPIKEEDAYRYLSRAGWIIEFREECYPYPDMFSDNWNDCRLEPGPAKHNDSRASIYVDEQNGSYNSKPTISLYVSK